MSPSQYMIALPNSDQTREPVLDELLMNSDLKISVTCKLIYEPMKWRNKYTCDSELTYIDWMEWRDRRETKEWQDQIHVAVPVAIGIGQAKSPANRRTVHPNPQKFEFVVHSSSRMSSG